MSSLSKWATWLRRGLNGSAHGSGRNQRRRGKPRTLLQLESLETRTVPSTFFPADNPWNQVISNAPVAANSAAIVNSIGASLSLHPDFGTTISGYYWGIPYEVVSGTQPKQTVVVDAYASESDIQPIPFPSNATDPNSGVIEGDPLPSAQNTGDRHVLIYDKDNHILYETWNTHRPSEEPDGKWHADAEAVWHTDVDWFRTPGWTSADAAGLPVAPGLVRLSEVQNGVIDHALRFTVQHTRNSYIFPASHDASSSSNTSYPRMGERFRLKASVNISSYPADDQVILKALQTYGMIVADNGSNWYLSGAPDPSWNDADINLLKGIHGSDFEVVDLTPEVQTLSTTSGSTAGGTAVTLNGLNFSGGAGLTKVYFGSTQATSITILSDTQIVATAPAHVAGTVHVTVQSGYGTSAQVTGDQFTFGGTVGTASTFVVSGLPASVTAGTAGTFTITVKDSSGNTVTAYTGTVHFTSSDAQAVLPADYTFTSSDQGVHTFSNGVTLKTAGSQTVTATDKATSSITSSVTVSVGPAAVSVLAVTGFPTPTSAGSSGTATVTARDAYGNTVSSYTGTVHFTSSDVLAVLPADYTYVAADKGTHSFNVTLKTIGVQSLTATDKATPTIIGTQLGISVVTSGTDTWTGNGPDVYWSDPKNWAAGVAPKAGDNLIFASGAAQLTNTNDLAGGTQFGTLTLSGSGYTIGGNAVSLTGGIDAGAASGNNTINLNVTLAKAETFNIGGSGTTETFGGAINTNGYTLTLGGGAGSGLYSGVISGAGGLITSYTGSVTLTGSNTYSGGTTLTGALQVGNNNALGTGTLAVKGGTISATGGPVTLANAMTVGTGGASFNGSQNLTFTGAVTLSLSSSQTGRTLRVNNTGLTTFAGAVGQTQAGGNFTKAGTGTLILSGTNTYTGSTVVQAGTLVVNGSISSSGAITVSSGATLAGSGTVGPVTVSSKGTLQLGPSSTATGILTAGGLALSSPSSFNLTLNGTTAGSGYDQLKTTGSVNLGSATLNISLGFIPVIGTSFTILSNQGGNAISGTFSGLAEGAMFTVGTETFQITYKGGSGKDVVITRIA